MEFVTNHMVFVILVGVVLAAQSLSSCTKSRITYYEEYKDGGACGYGDITTLTLPRGTYTAAANEAFYDDSKKCGVCYEMVGPAGTVRFMVTSRCAAVAGGSCTGDMIHFDMGKDAFPLLVDPSVGKANTTVRMVSCELTGPVQIQLKQGSSPAWLALFPRNHNVGVRSVEVSVDQRATWLPMQRSRDNCFTRSFSAQDPAPALPYVVRLTSIAGDSVHVVLDDVVAAKTYAADGQFPVASDAFFDIETLEKTAPPAHVPACCAVPDEWSVVYDDDGLKGVWRDYSSKATVEMDVRESPASGSSCMRVTMDGWGGLSIGTTNTAPLAMFESLRVTVRFSSEVQGVASLPSA